MSILYIIIFNFIFEKEGWWMWFYILLFVFGINMLSIAIVGIIAKRITPINPYPKKTYWIIYSFTFITNTILTILIIISTNFNSIKAFLFAVFFILFTWKLNFNFNNLFLAYQEKYNFDKEREEEELELFLEEKKSDMNNNLTRSERLKIIAFKNVLEKRNKLK